MRILITAVGERTEHWIDLVRVLSARPDLDLTLVLADVTPATARTLENDARQRPNLCTVVRPHALGERRTGHMASVLFGRGTGRLLRDQLRHRRPDIVHIIGEAAYLSTWQVLGWRAHYWPRTPVTLYAAQNIVMRFPPPFPILERRAYRAVDQVLPITPAALDVLRVKGYTGPATIVPLGVDTTLFAPRPAVPRQVGAPGARFTIGFVGRLEPHKGVADLVVAAERLDADLLIIGRGSLSDRVRAAAARRPGRVVLRDWAGHDELPALLAAMDVLALPSVEVVQRNVVPWIGIPLREQFGRVLIEAMACGVPVVGSRLGEIPYVVGDAGLTFPPGDVSALADQLARVRDETGLARRLGEEGIRRAQAEFSWDRVAQRLGDVWQAMVGTSVPASRKVDVG
jgi:glycosyltransferase involved in cell wall biosynthesis